MKGQVAALLLTMTIGSSVLVAGCEDETSQIAVKAPNAAAKKKKNQPPLGADLEILPSVPESPPPPEDDLELEADLKKIPELQKVLADPEKYRVEILFTEVRPSWTKGKKLDLTSHGYRVDREYFYPASSIKIVAALGAMEALFERGQKIGKRYAPDSAMRIFNADIGAYEDRDPSDTITGKMSLAQELKKMIVISDNESFNRIFDFVGQSEMNTRMWRLGLSSVRVRTRLGNFVKDNDDGAVTPEVDIIPGDGGPSLVTPARTSSLAMFAVHDIGTKVGSSHFEGDRKIDRPMDFAEKNRISVVDLQRILQKIVLPDADDSPRPNYDEGYRQFLMALLSMLPSQSKLTGYDTSVDEMQKLSLGGVSRVLPVSHAKVYGKSGRAYGFSIDNTYVVDTDSKRSFFLTAVIYTNESGVVGSDHYEYVEIANPFFNTLGEFFARRVFGAPAPRGK